MKPLATLAASFVVAAATLTVPASAHAGGPPNEAVAVAAALPLRQAVYRR